MTHNIKPALSVICTALFLLAHSAVFATESNPVQEANNLIKQGNFLAAYQLLEPLEVAHAGEIDFDYLLGLAAVESGNVTRGEFALERVLALEPNHKDARAEIAKAHFLLGETDTSKAEFKNVLTLNPDEQTKKTIQKLLTSIEKLEGTTTTYGAYLEFGLGHDSNVSSAPNISSISLPAFGGISISLDKGAREKADRFANIAASISFRHSFSLQLSAFGSASSSNRINGSETPFDNSSLDFNAGLDYKIDDNNGVTVALQDNHFDLDGEDFRHAYGASLQWLHSLNAYNQVGAYGQFSRLKYAGSSIRNADRSIIGINAGHVFEGDLKPVVYGSIYGGKENARSSIVDFLDQDIIGARLGGQLSFNNQWQGFANLAYEQRDYQAKDPIFLKERQDRQYDVALGLRYIPAREWTIKPQISYSKSDSNIGINAYKRTLISVTARKDFSW